MTRCPACGWSPTAYESDWSFRDYVSVGLLVALCLVAAGWIIAGEIGLVLVLCVLAAAAACKFLINYRRSCCAHNLLTGRYQIAYLLMMDATSTSSKEPDFERATRFLAAEAAHPMSLASTGYLGVRDISPTVQFVHLWPRDTRTIEKNLRALMAYITKFPNESWPFISDANQLLQTLKSPHYGGETPRLEERWAIFRATIERLGKESVEAGLQAARASIQAVESNTEAEPELQPQNERESDQSWSEPVESNQDEWNPQVLDQRPSWNIETVRSSMDSLSKEEKGGVP